MDREMSSRERHRTIASRAAHPQIDHDRRRGVVTPDIAWIFEVGIYPGVTDVCPSYGKEIERLRWSDEHMEGKLFADWKSFDHPQLGYQELSVDLWGETAFAEKLAPARTFAFERDVEQLRRSGLALGG